MQTESCHKVQASQPGGLAVWYIKYRGCLEWINAIFYYRQLIKYFSGYTIAKYMLKSKLFSELQ